MGGGRSIFEEVSAAPKAPARPAGRRAPARGAIRAWLGALFLLVAAMIAVGGLTRLTDSGLSITEWAPVAGALPPVSAEGWQQAFEAYKATPEYRLQNEGMSLAAFRRIYWWEWSHRQLGRVIGLVWAAGFLWFWLSGRLPRGWAGRLAMLGALGGAQGAIGWWMVSSGLTGAALDVAPYRLAVHLGLAFAILGLIAWFMLRLGRPERDLLQARRAREGRLAGPAGALAALAFLQVVLGALVAGLDAGRYFVDWPLMQGRLLPPGMWELQPVWRNLFENPGTAQFLHRLTGYALVLFGLWLWWRARASAHPATRGAMALVAVLLIGQLALGIAAVMNAAPLPLAIAHQITAVALWAAILRARFRAIYPLATSVRAP